jgi:hypothetical protein
MNRAKSTRRMRVALEDRVSHVSAPHWQPLAATRPYVAARFRFPAR